MSSSIQSVLQTPELLLLISRQLDRRSLLTIAQPVSKRWRRMMKHDPVIQQILFFKGMTDSDPDFLGMFNPILVELFPGWLAGGNRRSQSILNFYADLALAKTERRREAFLRPKASWRRMLVRQPPVYTVARSVVAGYKGGGRRYSRPTKRTYKGGLTMGALYDFARVDQWMGLFWRCEFVVESESWLHELLESERSDPLRSEKNAKALDDVVKEAHLFVHKGYSVQHRMGVPRRPSVCPLYHYPFKNKNEIRSARPH
jgi:hypothetical protein